MKKVVQIRYYGNGNGKNSKWDHLNDNGEIVSEDLTKDNFNENLSEYSNILQIGIQSFPGAAFSLNEGIDKVLIGTTGIYELNLENLIDINKLSIDNDTLDLINKSSGSLYVIIDLLYEEVSE